MNRGHVDEVTRQFVSGWAADFDDPNGLVDVCILLNGERVARITCDQLRDDLRDAGIYGEGRHGFLYEFAAPLDEDFEAKIGVRFALSGAPLSNGDAVLAVGTSKPVFSPQPLPAIAAPISPSGLFRFLGLLDANQGLYELLCRLDLRGVQPQELHDAVLGQAAARPEQNTEWNSEIARDYLEALLRSAEFQQNILTLALRAFPDKRRLLFVHIPKCAGTDLALHLSSRFPSLEEYLADERRTGKGRLFEVLAHFARELPFFDSVFAVSRGHISLSYYIDADLIRPSDRVFAIVRDPMEIAISSINYIITRFEQDIISGNTGNDTREWLDLLSISHLPPEITTHFINDVIRASLRNPEVVRPNSICHWLGSGDAETVIARLASYHVEITNVARYNDWLEQEWGVRTRARENVSKKYLTLSTLGHEDLVHIRTLSPEDQKLCNLVTERLAALNRVSVVGTDLL